MVNLALKISWHWVLAMTSYLNNCLIYCSVHYIAVFNGILKKIDSHNKSELEY